MAREYGKIPSSWWTQGNGRKLRGDSAAVHVAVYLRSHAQGNILGLFYLGLPTIAHETGVNGADLDRVLARLAELGEAHVDREADLVWVPDLAGGELGDRPLLAADKRKVGALRALEQIGTHAYRAAFVARYGAILGLLGVEGATLPSPSRDPLEGSPPAPSKARPLPLPSQDQGQEHEQTQGQEPAPCADARVREVQDFGPLMADLRAEGSKLQASIDDRMAKGWRPTPGQLQALRKIRDERAAGPALAVPRGVRVQAQGAGGAAYKHPEF